MIKPSSSKCNMKCKYCFYNDVSENREIADKGPMSSDLLALTLKKAFEYTKGQDVRISFQGGEPLLRGKQFFYEYERLIKELNIYSSRVFCGIQTNGTLIDDEWCDFFLRTDTLVGISLDGPESINSYRVDKDDNPVFDRVFEAVKLLQRKGVKYNILSVLTPKVANNIEEVYKFFKSNGCDYLQFIPCLKPLDDKTDTEFSLSGDDYYHYLDKCFPLYFTDYMRGDYTSVRTFDNMVKLTKLQRAEQCGMNGHCTHQYVIEGNGDLYPCDFYCLDEQLLGNINETDFYTVEHSAKAIDFIKESMVIADKCKQCRWFALCKNGCKRERCDFDKCTATQKFFDRYIGFFKSFKC